MTPTRTNDDANLRGPHQTAKVLIVDNNPEVIRLLLEILAQKGIHGTVSKEPETAADSIDKCCYDLVFLGNKISKKSNRSAEPDESFALLNKIRTNSPQTPVIMVTEFGAAAQKQLSRKSRSKITAAELIETAVRAIKAGCSDFLTTPLKMKKVADLLDTVLPNHPVKSCAWVRNDNGSVYNMVGSSAKLVQTIDLAKRIAPTSVPVLISGESGTGKEMVSYLIHDQSKRAHGPYVRVNCAALSDTLLESELFGHEKGAFTGALATRRGRFEMAHGGTLLLDEITETPPRFQATLLRVLEQQDFERVGGEKQIKVDVRIISTTNKDLMGQVQEGKFRHDLYYRLSGLRVTVPPLRERVDDLPELVWHFVNLYANQTQRRITKLDPAMMDIFNEYHWPGNIRQLRNVVLTSLILGTGPALSLADVSWLFDELQPLPQRKQSVETICARTDAQTQLPLAGLPLEQIERRAILETLRQTAGNQTKAAKVLGISDRTLREKIRRYRQKQCLQPV